MKTIISPQKQDLWSTLIFSNAVLCAHPLHSRMTEGAFESTFFCQFWLNTETYAITERELQTRCQTAQCCQTAKISLQCLHSCEVPSSQGNLRKMFYTRTQESTAFFDLIITLSLFRAKCLQVFSATKQQSS